MRPMKYPIILLLLAVMTVGCATTRARKPEPAVSDSASQITQLQSDLAARDRQIADLQARLDSYERALTGPATNVRHSSKTVPDAAFVKVTGVSVSDVQRALAKAGFDPGPIDGRAGKKTRSAVKAFQRGNGLSDDGVVGSRTWSVLSGQ